MQTELLRVVDNFYASGTQDAGVTKSLRHTDSRQQTAVGGGGGAK